MSISNKEILIVLFIMALSFLLKYISKRPPSMKLIKNVHEVFPKSTFDIIQKQYNTIYIGIHVLVCMAIMCLVLLGMNDKLLAYFIFFTIASTILSWVIALVLMCIGLFVGYVCNSLFYSSRFLAIGICILLPPFKVLLGVCILYFFLDIFL
jgi:hypothetical protein